MNTWVMNKKPELIPVPIDPKTYQKKIIEIAQRLYETLNRQQESVPCPTPSRASFNPRGERSYQ